MMARRVIAGRSGFSPKALFAAGEQGVWYDPSDFSTLFQDAAGTTPVTAVEQPVGLVLDKSKGLVATQLITNGSFNTSIDGWSTVSPATASWTSAGILVSRNGASFQNQAATPISLVAGNTYFVSVDVTTTPTQGNGGLEIWNASRTAARYLVGNFRRDTVGNLATSFVATSTENALVVVGISGSTAGTVTFDNISVRELPGNHAFQVTSASRPVLSARYNLLTNTERFDDAAWIKYNISVTANNTTAPDGTLTADRLTTFGLSSTVYIETGYPAGTYTQSVYAKAGTNTHIYFQTVSGGVSRGLFNLSTGIVDLADNCTAGMIDAGNGWYRCWMTFNSSGRFRVSYYTCAGLDTYVNGNYNYIWGADLRVANDALNQPAYQRVNTATDYDTVGFKPYLRFNGTNQWLQTNSIDFTYGDKMFVSAGVRKLSDAARGMVTEFTSGTTNSFQVNAPNSPTTDQYLWGSRGSGAVSVAKVTSGYLAPTTNVLSGIGDISGASAVLRINGAQVASSTASQGTGNYANAPLYIGARAGSSLFFNGHLYSLIVRGAQTNTNLIAATERYVARKTGVVL